MKNRGTIPKDTFPRLLKRCLEKIGNESIAKNITSGFKAAGLVPLDQKKVLSALPKKVPVTEQDKLENDESHAGMVWVAKFQEYLKANRKKETETVNQGKRKLMCLLEGG